MIGKYCMVRSKSAGVFAGTVEKRDGGEVLLSNARRIWYWDGAASLSQLATEGTSKPTNGKFPAPVAEVLLLEVIEHLHTSPRHVLRYLYRCLNPGGFLIVSTPNAAFLRNRLQLLAGSNPFEPIREDAMNPGHFREYTRRELAGHCRECGFDVLEARVENLFCYGPGSGRLFSAITRWLPADFRRDITLIIQRPGQAGNET